MKKVFLSIMIIGILFFTGCSIKFEKKSNCCTMAPDQETIPMKEDGVILEYYSYPNYGTSAERDNYNFITLYHNRELVWGTNLSGAQYKRVLNDSEFSVIISMAFIKAFKNLGEDISDNSILDGNSTYVTVYYKDGTSFKTGGLNPTNSYFKELTRFLNEYATNDEKYKITN